MEQIVNQINILYVKNAINIFNLFLFLYNNIILFNFLLTKKILFQYINSLMFIEIYSFYINVKKIF